MLIVTGRDWLGYEQTLCAQCQPGLADLDGLPGTVCEACSNGTWAGVGVRQCAPCAAGRFGVDPSKSCVGCPKGSYSPNGASRCKLLGWQQTELLT